MWAPRWKQLREIVSDLNPNQIGDEIKKKGITTIPRAWFDHGYAGCHIVVQSWDHIADNSEWNFSLWVIDSIHPEMPSCSLVRNFGTTWVHEKELLVSVVEEITKWHGIPFIREAELDPELWICPFCASVNDDDECHCGNCSCLCWQEEIPFNSALN